MANTLIKGMGFHHIALRCADIGKSLAMYKQLGMQEKMRWGEKEKQVVMLDIGDGGIIEMFANGSSEYAVKGKWNHFALRVDNIDEAYAAALAAGFKALIPPKFAPLETANGSVTLNIAFVTGPDGEEIEFFRFA